jgi:hypothetical protein
MLALEDKQKIHAAVDDMWTIISTAHDGRPVQSSRVDIGFDGFTLHSSEHWQEIYRAFVSRLEEIITPPWKSTVSTSVNSRKDTIVFAANVCDSFPSHLSV